MNHFDEAAATWDDDPRKQSRALHTAQAIVDAVPFPPSAHLLDIGGATGLLGALLAARLNTHGHFTLLDASAGMVEVARRRLSSLPAPAPRTDVVLGTSPTPGMPGAPYDVIVSSLAFHHLPDIPGTLRALHDVTAPDATLIICDLDPDPEGAFHQHVDDFAGHHGLSRDVLRDDVVAAGFTDVAFRDLPPLSKEVAGHERSFGLFMLTARRAGVGA